MRIFYLFGLQPLYKKGEVVGNFFSNEDSVNHMAAKESHFDFVPCMRVDFAVLMNRFEDIGGSGAIGKLQVIKSLFIYIKFVSFFKVLNGHILKNYSNLTICILKHQMCFHVLLLHLIYILFIFSGFDTFVPAFVVYIDLSQRLRNLSFF